MAMSVSSEMAFFSMKLQSALCPQLRTHLCTPSRSTYIFCRNLWLNEAFQSQKVIHSQRIFSITPRPTILTLTMSIVSLTPLLTVIATLLSLQHARAFVVMNPAFYSLGSDARTILSSNLDNHLRQRSHSLVLFMGRAAAVRASTKAKTDAKKAKTNAVYGKKIIMAGKLLVVYMVELCIF